MKEEYNLYALVYIPLLDVAGGAILEFYNSVTMYLTHNISENKVNVYLEFLFLLHLNDGDRCGSFGNTVLSNLVRQSEFLIYSAKEDQYFLEFSEYCYFMRP